MMRLSVLLCGLVGLWVFGAVAVEAREGRVVEIDLPITPKSAEVVRRTTEQVARDGLPDRVFFVFRTNTTSNGRGSNFGGCYEVAETISRDLGAARTIAVVPKSLYGHAVLVALACDEIVLGPDAEFGDAADGETLTDTVRSAYHEIARRRHADLPRSLIDKMLDPRVEILEAESDETTYRGSAEELEALATSRGIAFETTRKVVVPAGMTGIYTALDARRFGIASRLETDLTTIAHDVGVAPESLRRARIVGTVGRALLVDVAGTLTPSKANTLVRLMTKRLAPGDRRDAVSLVCFRIDSPGGSLIATQTLADYIVGTLRPRGIHSVAYVPETALADAAVIALCCDETILGATATLGGDGATVFSRDEIDTVVPFLEPILTAAFQPLSPALAMFDGSQELFVWTHQSDQRTTRLMSLVERDRLADRERWAQGAMAKQRGPLLQLTAKDAVTYRLATATVRDYTEFKTVCGLDTEPDWLEGGMVDQFVRALADPRWSLVVLFVAFMSLSAELKTPGLGLGGFVAMIAFTLFFWSHFLNGTAEWLEIILFATGAICLLLEIFVIPGFGLFGVGGMILIVMSLVLAGQTFVIPHNSYQLARMQWSLLTLLLATAGATLVAAMAVRVVHAASRPDADEVRERAEGEKLADYAHLLGATGICATPLVPAGRVVFGETPVGVVADGEFVEVGSRVAVIAVSGYRVVVRKTTEDEKTPAPSEA